jgi:hypothetical protein
LLQPNQQSTGYAQPDRLKAANLKFFTLNLFATESDKFGPL